MTSGPFLAADWGTTNLRAWRLDASGQVLQRVELPLGVSQLGAGEAAARFESEVRPALQAQELPALLCGMIGSTLGWANAPYLDCPVSLAKLAANLLEVVPGVRIVPGLTCAGLVGPDLMRGEETQVLGWQAADPARLRGRHLLCHPGTHAKWVRMEEGAVTRFTTAMTGELYDLLGSHGVLKFGAPPGGEAFDPDAFDRGVAAAGDGGALTSRLFGLRGLTVSGGLPADAAPSWLSGLLIGAEVASLWPIIAAAEEKVVHVVGTARLCDRYARVLMARGVGCEIADGEAAALAGLTRIWAARAVTLEDALAECPLVAILRGVTPTEIIAHGEALLAAGVRAAEIPLNSPEPLESIRRLAGELGGRIAVGAGTVLSPAAVDEVSAAGALFVVSPNTDLAVIARTVQLGLTPFPGFATPSEAFAAIAAGARLLKLFPASTYGPGHLRAVKTVLPPDVRLYPVGGVGPEQMAAWREAGAAGFGLGSDLYRPGQSAEDTLRKARASVAAARS